MRGQTSTLRAKYARLAAAACPLLRAAARSPAVCSAVLLHLTEWRHRPHFGHRQRAHGDRAGAAGRGGRPQRQEQSTPAPPPPRARCCAPPLAHLPCVPRRCSTVQDGDTALIWASRNGHTAIVALLKAAQRNRPVAVPAAEAPCDGAGAAELATGPAAACPAPPVAPLLTAAAAAAAAADTAASSSSSSDDEKDTFCTT